MAEATDFKFVCTQRARDPQAISEMAEATDFKFVCTQRARDPQAISHVNPPGILLFKPLSEQNLPDNLPSRLVRINCTPAHRPNQIQL